jgi:hypothetical protein
MAGGVMTESRMTPGMPLPFRRKCARVGCTCTFNLVNHGGRERQYCSLACRKIGMAVKRKARTDREREKALALERNRVIDESETLLNKPLKPLEVVVRDTSRYEGRVKATIFLLDRGVNDQIPKNIHGAIVVADAKERIKLRGRGVRLLRS